MKWALSEMDVKRLGTWERKILRKDLWTADGARNMENKNRSGIERAI
jgi:hypothetical protein